MDARGLRWAWGLIPLAAVLFTFSAGRSWPIHLPGKLPGGIAPAAGFFVYAPADGRLDLEAGVLPATPQQAPQLHVSIQQGKTESSTIAAPARPSGDRGALSAKVPLDLKRGVNAVRLTLRAGGGAADAPFSLQTATVNQRIFQAGNTRFCLALVALVIASMLASAALGADGAQLWCGASLIGFLLVTSTATVLSYAHALTSGTWAGVLAGVCAIVSVSAGAICRRAPPRPLASLGGVETIILLALICPMFVMQTLSSVNAFDDLMYHGPRTAYWMQNASALPFVSHNDRLSVFPMGGDLLFAFGTIISGSELPGKFMVFLAYPLSLFAMRALLKTLGVRSPTALGVVAIFALSPLVFTNAVGLKPDLWLVLLGVVTLHWVIVAQRTGSLVPGCLAAAGAAAALGVKWTAGPLVVLTPLLLFLPRQTGSGKRRAAALGLTLMLAVALGGAGPILVSNLRASHHPFGSSAMREVHQPAPGLHPIIVQLKRLPFILVDPPIMPSEWARAALEQWEGSAAQAIGATELLREEAAGGWPGRFGPHVTDIDDHFSLAWLFVIFGAIGAAAICFRKGARSDARFAVVLLLGASAVFTIAVVTQTRWQAAAGLPDRFLMPALAFGLLGAAWPLDQILSRRQAATAVFWVTAALHALPFFLLLRIPFAVGTRIGWRTPLNFDTGSEFEVISHLLPPGRTILLVTGQGSREYPLVRAREGFANRVIPWGKSAYDQGAFDRALTTEKIDTVIIADSKEIPMLWDPSFSAQPFLDDLAARPDFQRAPVVGDPAVFVRVR